MHHLHLQAVQAIEIRVERFLLMGVRKPIVQREYTEIGPEAVGSLFIRYGSTSIQVNKSSDLRTDLKTVEPSYTSAPCQLKGWIACAACFWSIEYGGGGFGFSCAPGGAFVAGL